MVCVRTLPRRFNLSMNCKDALSVALAAADQMMGATDNTGLYAMGVSRENGDPLAMVIVRGDKEVKGLLEYYRASNGDEQPKNPFGKPSEYPDYGGAN